METFKIRQSAFKEIKKQMLIKLIPINILVMVVSILIFSITTSHKEADIIPLFITIPAMVLFLSFGTFKGIDKQMSNFMSYTLTISNNVLTRESFNTPTISIKFDEVKSIVKNPNGSFIIKGEEKSDIIIIPFQIDNYEQLESELHQIQRILVKNKNTFLEKYQGWAGIFTLGLMYCFYTQNNKIVVGLTGSAILAIMIWGFISIRKSKSLDNSIIKRTWFLLVLIASIIGVMILKLTGIMDNLKH